MKQYLDLMKKVIEEGNKRSDCLSIFGGQLDVNLRAGFPLLTTKELSFRDIVVKTLELVKGLSDSNVEGMVSHIKEKPESLDHVLLMQRPGVGPTPAVAPWAQTIQFYVSGPGNSLLSSKVAYRASDMFYNVPLNIASMALLTHMVARLAGKVPSKLIMSFADLWVDDVNLEEAKEQIAQKTKALPSITLPNSISSFKKLCEIDPEDIILTECKPKPIIDPQKVERVSLGAEV